MKSKLALIIFVFLFPLCMIGQATITIEVNWPNWSSENRVTFRDASDVQIGNSICNPAACFNGSGNNSYNTIGNPETYNSVPYGTGYDLLLQDTWGDGWNGFGSYVRVYQDGVLILDTDLTGGTSTTVSFDIIAPSPRIEISDISINEVAGTATFIATHTGVDTGGLFSVNFTTNDGSATAGSDYTTTTTPILNFNGTVGDTEQITVPILDDFAFEGNETFTVQFTATSDNSVDISDTATGTIVDNENDPNTTRPYEERNAMNLQGNFKVLANTNLECVSGCPATPTTNNPGANMGYVDIDSDGATQNSSSATLTLPVGATVQWAGLYWGGMYSSTFAGITNPTGLDIDQVQFRTPGTGGYSIINSEVRNVETTSFAGWNSFMSFAEVTSLVQAGGNGNYFVADIALATGRSFTGPYGGWNLIVIYEDPTELSRNIAVWDGFEFFGFGANDSFTVTGLLTPSSGAFESHAAYFGFDGEANRTGDFVSIEGTSLSNGLNPANNTLNGTISEFGVDLGTRNPNYSYSWGIDSDVFDASGLVPNSSTEMDVVLGSSSEGIWGGVFVTSNEIAFPSVASKSFSPTSIAQGAESRVTITIDNPSNGVNLTNFSMTDNLPSGMVIAGTPDATSSSGGTISAIPGSSNFTISGLSVPTGTTCIFSFDVETLRIGDYQNTIYPVDTSNDQNIPFAGEYTGNLSVRPGTVITNRRITYRVNKN